MSPKGIKKIETSSSTAEVPLHHHPVVQSMETGAPFMQAGIWGDFISAILSASATIDARRAARQQSQESNEGSVQSPPNVSTGHKANA